MRWEICYNLTMLRMVSFGLDLHWATQQAQQAAQQGKGQAAEATAPGSRVWNGKEASPAPPTAAPGGGDAVAAARWRQRMPLGGRRQYGLLLCLAYCLYPPLYLAGPILTFQDYAWQLAQRARPPARQVRCARAAPGAAGRASRRLPAPCPQQSSTTLAEPVSDHTLP